MFEFVVAALREDGVTGALELYVPPGPPPLPRRFDLVECQLRIRDGAEEGRVLPTATRCGAGSRPHSSGAWPMRDDAITSVSTGFGGQFAVSVSAILARYARALTGRSRSGSSACTACTPTASACSRSTRRMDGCR